MGWNNPAMPWAELERRLSGRPDLSSEAPISRRKSRPKQTDVAAPDGPVVPYAELHCHSGFSFLDGASSPDQLVLEAIRLGLDSLAITDHDGFHGAPLFAETAQVNAAPSGRSGLRTAYGSELSLDLGRAQQGVADPEGTHLLVLARGVEGYHRLAAAITDAHLRGQEKGRPVYDLAELGERGRGHWLVLTGCRKGAVRSALAAEGPAAAARELRRLVELFGRDSVAVELVDHGYPTDSATNDLLFAMAAEHGLPAVATNNVHHARPGDHRLAAAMAAIRARRSLAEMDGWLPASGAASLRSGEEMARRFARYPGAVARSVELADQVVFDLQKATPRLPKDGIPEGHTPISWLKVLTWRGFEERYYGTDLEAEARAKIHHELEVIERKDFAGYFVIVHDIVAFARSRGILCQGRGSAASSVVCHALGITAIDPVFYKLPFERFISEHRDEEPDIDVDFDSDRREEVIQWVYERYGRHNAAQVANVISYRPKMAVRDAAKALGFSPGQQDAWSKSISSWSRVEPDGDPGETAIPEPVVALANQLLAAPRHLGIHSGGMVLTERPIGEVCPIEHARMENRTVLQWDKDGCEFMGLVKFDLLGLGMLSALDHMMRIAAEHLGDHWELATIPKEEPAVYDMLCRADSIGVFQVESRAQIGTLPRLQPRCFYDLAIEIALIRPGPIQGGAVHPYVRRATGRDPVEYPHPELVPVLERTLGVPLFQEQLMDMAKTIGDCTPDEADLLRRAMGSKRGIERIESIKHKLYAGMERRGIVGDDADAIYVKILSFANFGFAESHALSFAKLVYASSWFKLHYPGAFLAGLLRAQPMGFYSAQSLVGDARRHGVTVLKPDLERSRARADLEPLGPGARTTGMDSCLLDHPGKTFFVPGTPDPTPQHRRDAAYAVRLGLDSVRGIGPEVAARIVAARAERPFRDQVDLSRRAGLDTRQLEALATAGVFDSSGLTRRQALWNAGWTEQEDQLEGVRASGAAPMLPDMDEVEVTMADLWATGVTTDSHPFGHLRDQLRRAGIRSVADLAATEANRRISVAGLVTHRQRPGTAGGVTFLNLEDETGMLNVICTVGVWRRHRKAAAGSAAVVIRGMLEREDGATNLVADKISSLEELHPEAGRALRDKHRSRDFR
ncbi:error-prone DNA polymerase [Nocardioides marmotae]|uniref:Error-prone DNA polymerase n=1 Tax=Nocardioides marmotae TaxID=2663857 RepID=A0A6I3JGS3_9ACTN|nr:error-prone DNA polymerase [Nocardioides marmotae]MCR6033577.1 DNA polymerase III subunit alpha [Gordonia jinghuaiqii]MBC9735531.1 error-prone DNA polymerase [Nocardioides marmotae]MTB86628.1 DNA polymerase III subunit alpha [Nocardioides marmotae]MTB97235.1 DNA polymerase III subunit alpha [Nocardioides marmotae]QKE02149.1 error-prone DNA polymerase [Nocardioides marmotae]